VVKKENIFGEFSGTQLMTTLWLEKRKKVYEGGEKKRTKKRGKKIPR